MASQWVTLEPNMISYYSNSTNVKVGINNTNASYALDVTGDSRFRNGITTGNMNINGTLSVSGNVSIGNLYLDNFTTSNLFANEVNYGMANTYSGSFIAANNVSSPTDVTGLLFTNTSSFTINLNVTIQKVTVINPYLSAYFLLEGVYKDDSWILLKSYSGDNTGIIFSITSSGQIQYTSTNLSGWGSTTFRYFTTQISNTGNYSSSINSTQGNYIFDTLQLNNTNDSIMGSNNGALYLLGGATFEKKITIKDTTNSSAIGSGGSLTVLGGGAISKDLYVGQNVNVAGDVVTTNLNLGLSSQYSGSFLASNNTVTYTNITNLTFSDISSFIVYLNISLIRSAGGNLYAYFILEGFKNDSGWTLFKSYTGDETGINFEITNAGQIQYTSTNMANWTSNTFRFSVNQISNTGTYSSLQGQTQGSYSINTIQLNNTVGSLIGTNNGALYSLGGATFEKSVSIKDTTNSSGVQTGGSFTVLGGASISKNVYMGSNLIVTGDISALGTISDIRFKTNIQNLSHNLSTENLPNSLDIVNSLRPVTFTWNEHVYNTFKDKKDVGFVAQEVEKLIPYAVDEFSYSEDGDKYKKLRHERIIPYLVEAIQQLTQKINYLEDKLQSK
jgi:hypothetical protein